MPFSFNLTRTQIASLVLGKLGFGAGQSTESADVELVYQAIDLRLKEAHKLGVYWRKVDKQPLSFTLTANIASASASADVLLPLAMHVVDGSLDCPVRIIGVQEWAGIENKSKTGIPTRVLWEGGAKFQFHPTPTSNTTAKLTYEKYADDTSAGAAIDVDPAFLRSYRDIICYDLGDFYHKDEATIVRWKMESEQAERAIRRMASERVGYRTVVMDEYPTEPSDYE